MSHRDLYRCSRCVEAGVLGCRLPARARGGASDICSRWDRDAPYPVKPALLPLRRRPVVWAVIADIACENPRPPEDSGRRLVAIELPPNCAITDVNPEGERERAGWSTPVYPGRDEFAALRASLRAARGLLLRARVQLDDSTDLPADIAAWLERNP